MGNKIKTYITYFDDNQINEYNLKASDGVVLFKANDESYSGESINKLNTFYCELCTMYYIWKNDLKSDYIELKQYRRKFDWQETFKLPGSGEIICYEPLKLNGMPIIYQYAIYHGKKRAYSLMGTIKDMFGDKSDVFDYFIKCDKLYTNNTFVINWNDFVKMCEFVFNVTDKIDKNFKLNYNFSKYMSNSRKFTEDGRFDYQTHWMAYIGERLVSCYITTKMKPLTIPRLEGNGFYAPYEHGEP